MSHDDGSVAEANAGIELGVLNDVIGFRIRRIQNHLSRSFSERINRKEIRPGLFSGLALIAANPGLSQTMLATELGFDKATVVALLDSMERLGWAERRRAADDRRRHALHATADGVEALGRLRGIAMANEAQIRDVLNEAERAQLFDLLDKLYVACFARQAALTRDSALAASVPTRSSHPRRPMVGSGGKSYVQLTKYAREATCS